MIDVRLRAMISDEELEQKIGKIVTDDDFNLLVTKDCRVRKPDGSLLCIYRRGVISDELGKQTYPVLHSLKGKTTANRGHASGMQRSRKHPGGRTSTTKDVPSALVGGLDPSGPQQYCRLTAWTGRETEQYQALWPLLQEMGRIFEANVPDRFANQMKCIKETHPDWVIPDTPFTTVTVNNTYPTGVHTDKGDLDEGFSCLSVLRRGDYTGGALVFPRFRVAVDLRDTDMILMDAHEFHGNTMIEPRSEDAERISIVAYYRTGMVACASLSEEEEKRFSVREERNAKALGVT